MSKFVTAIPVDVAEVKKLLPPGACVERVHWNPELSQVEVVWDHMPAHTGFDFPVAFSQEDLAARRMPKGVRQRPKPAKAAGKGKK